MGFRKALLAALIARKLFDYEIVSTPRKQTNNLRLSRKPQRLYIQDVGYATEYEKEHALKVHASKAYLENDLKELRALPKERIGNAEARPYHDGGEDGIKAAEKILGQPRKDLASIRAPYSPPAPDVPGVGTRHSLNIPGKFSKEDYEDRVYAKCDLGLAKGNRTKIPDEVDLIEAEAMKKVVEEKCALWKEKYVNNNLRQDLRLADHRHRLERRKAECEKRERKREKKEMIARNTLSAMVERVPWFVWAMIGTLVLLTLCLLSKVACAQLTVQPNSRPHFHGHYPAAGRAGQEEAPPWSSWEGAKLRRRGAY